MCSHWRQCHQTREAATFLSNSRGTAVQAVIWSRSAAPTDLIGLRRALPGGLFDKHARYIQIRWIADTQQ